MCSSTHREVTLASLNINFLLNSRLDFTNIYMCSCVFYNL